MANVRIKIIQKKKKKKNQNIDCEKFVYTHEDIMMPMIISCRVSTPEATEFRSKLGFKQHDIALSEGCRIDLYFLKQKLAIEVDEKGHIDRGKRKKKK